MNYSTYEQKFREKAIDSGYSEDNIHKCLRYAKPLIDKGFPVIYNTSNLAALVGYKRSYLKRAIYFTDYFYRKFSIVKKNGRLREISEPLPSLKEIQQWILENILYNATVSKFAKAYLPNKKITENVRFHKGQNKVMCLDVSDFFQSIKLESIITIFNKIGYSPRVSDTLGKLCCLQDCLPQGAPTSPQLSNIYMYKFDKSIADYCVENKIRYTRYADDLTFSGTFDHLKLLELVEEYLGKLDLAINPQKTKIMTREMRQVVTGIVVNDKIQVPKEKRKELRQAVYYIKKFGLSSHLQKINCTKGNYVKHLIGSVNYVLFINPNDDEALKQKEFLINLLKDKNTKNI